MRMTEATIFCLRIPFVEAFSHSTSARVYSDSIVVRVTAADGTVGYGEGVARPYVTGETVESCVTYIVSELWPAVARTDYADISRSHDPLSALSSIIDSLPDHEAEGLIAGHGARTAIELALIDCLLRSQKLSLGELLPAKRPSVTYSGVITAGSADAAVRHARYLKLFGIKHLKIKIGATNPVARVAAIRRAVGPETSLRVDANGAYDPETANRVLSASRSKTPQRWLPQTPATTSTCGFRSAAESFALCRWLGWLRAQGCAFSSAATSGKRQFFRPPGDTSPRICPTWISSKGPTAGYC